MTLAPLLLSAAVSAVPTIGSTAAADPRGLGAWFVDVANDEVLLVHPRKGVDRFACPWPSQVVVADDGAAYAACRGDGTVRRLTEPVATWAVGPEPSALALDSATGLLYAALATANEVVELQPATDTVKRRLATAYEPTALAVYQGALVIGSRRSARVQHLPLATGGERRDEVLAHVTQGAALGIEHFVTAGDSLLAIVSSAALGSLEEPTYYSSFDGFPVAEQLYRLDAPGWKWTHVTALDAADISAAQWLDGPRMLLVASRGTGRVASHVLPKVKGRVKEGPTKQSLGTGLTAYVDAGFFSYSFNDVTRSIAVRVNASGIATTLQAPPVTRDAELEKGRKLFHDATDRRIASGRLACASCHVDGRDDGRTWVGQGAMRQTPALAGRDIANTAPYGWNGKYATLEEYIRFTITTRMHGIGLPLDELKALARYVREGLPKVRRPEAPADGAVARGSVVFHASKASCASCHPSDDAFSDGAKHNVGSVGRAEVDAQALQLEAAAPPPLLQPVGPLAGLLGIRGLGTAGAPQAEAKWRAKVDRSLDTPSLLQVGLTAPYLHDGSAQTLDEVFTRLGNHMGAGGSLSPRERADLVEYLKTL